MAPQTKTQKRFEACKRMLKYKREHPEKSTMAGFLNTLEKLPDNLKKEIEGMK